MPIRIDTEAQYGFDEDIIIKNFVGGSKQLWRLEFVNLANPDNYIEIGRMFLGNYFEPSRQFARGWEEMLIDPSRVEQSKQGQEWVDLREKHRLVRVEFPEATPSTSGFISGTPKKMSLGRLN